MINDICSLWIRWQLAAEKSILKLEVVNCVPVPANVKYLPFSRWVRIFIGSSQEITLKKLREVSEAWEPE